MVASIAEGPYEVINVCTSRYFPDTEWRQNKKSDLRNRVVAAPNPAVALEKETIKGLVQTELRLRFRRRLIRVQETKIIPKSGQAPNVEKINKFSLNLRKFKASKE